MKLKYLVTLFTSIALLTPLGARAFAVPTCTTTICDITITGTYHVYEQTAPGLLTAVPVGSLSIDNVKGILIDNKPGNVELGSFLTPTLLTTMEVTFAGGSTATFSNPLEKDWTDNGNALAHSYITAAGNYVGITLSPSELALATT